MDWLYWLLVPMNLFLFFPPLAFLPAIGLFLVYRKRKARSAAIAAGLLWAAYGVYECYMSWVWSPTVIAPIRIDLIPITIVLFLSTLFAILSFRRS